MVAGWRCLRWVPRHSGSWTGGTIPLYRVAEFVLAVPILCAAAVVAAPRLAGDRRWLGVAIGVAHRRYLRDRLPAIGGRCMEGRILDHGSCDLRGSGCSGYLPAHRPCGQPHHLRRQWERLHGFRSRDPRRASRRPHRPGPDVQGASADLLAGRPPSFGQADDIQRSWEGVKDLLHEDYVAIWLSSLNRLADAPAGARAVAPGVMVIRGPDPTVAQRLSVSDGPSQGELIRAGVTALAILLIVGLGWSAALVDAGWLARLGLAPAFGVAVLVLGGVIGARVGWSLVGAAGSVLFAALAMSGWLIVGVEAVVGRYRAKESGGVAYR